MRAHQNTILAMKVSTLLMSVSAVALVIMLLTSNAVAKQNSESAVPIEVMSDIAPVAAAPIVDTAPPPVKTHSKLVIMRVIAITATPDTSAATNAMRLAQQGRSAIAVGGQPVDGSVASASSGSSSSSLDMPSAPALTDISSIAAPQAVAQAAAPAQSGTVAQSAAAAPAPASKPAPAPAPAPKPAPKPQPIVKTKTI